MGNSNHTDVEILLRRALALLDQQDNLLPAIHVSQALEFLAKTSEQESTLASGSQAAAH